MFLSLIEPNVIGSFVFNMATCVETNIGLGDTRDTWLDSCGRGESNDTQYVWFRAVLEDLQSGAVSLSESVIMRMDDTRGGYWDGQRSYRQAENGNGFAQTRRFE